jgi:hypothetical protein
MISGILFLAVVVLLAFGVRWISHHNDPMYNRNEGENITPGTEEKKPKDKNSTESKRS